MRGYPSPVLGAVAPFLLKKHRQQLRIPIEIDWWNTTSKGLAWMRFRRWANMEHLRQSRPDSGLGVQVKMSSKPFQLFLLRSAAVKLWTYEVIRLRAAFRCAACPSIQWLTMAPSYKTVPHSQPTEPLLLETVGPTISHDRFTTNFHVKGSFW